MMNHVGEKVKRLRISKGWSQEQLAREIPVSASTVQRWEYGGPIRSLAARQVLEGLFNQAGIDEEEGERT
ncbi:hypothetical protein LCGC14_1175400 [marine sediment metagenome]|uniref:HTH cro/C1-type domain-containing protein n=1 Tax=marine sediment metagenome TaxID=412755 RepID=A0A0F9P6P5_9ZZZZ